MAGELQFIAPAGVGAVSAFRRIRDVPLRTPDYVWDKRIPTRALRASADRLAIVALNYQGSLRDRFEACRAAGQTGSAIFNAYTNLAVTNNVRPAGSASVLGTFFGEYNAARDMRIIQLAAKFYF